MISDAIFMLLFIIFFNWSVNMQVMAKFEKGKREQLIAIAIALFCSIVLGILIRV